MITKNKLRRKAASPKKGITFRPSPENRSFLEAKKSQGISYTFAIENGLSLLRAKEAKAKA